MNARDRMAALWRNQVPDRFPVPFIKPWRETLARWHREGLPEGAEPNRYLGVEGYGVAMLPLDMGLRPPFPVTVHSADSRFVVLTDECGVTKRMFRSDFDATAGRMEAAGETSAMAEWLRFPVQSRRDWDILLAQRLSAGLDARLPEDWMPGALQDRVTCVFSFPFLGSFGAVRQLMGYENLVYALYDDPSLVHAIMKDLTDLWIRVFSDLCRRVRLDWIVLFEDMCGTGGPLVSPEMYGEFFGQPVARFLQAVRELGVSCAEIDSDGRIDRMVPEWMRIGIRAVSPCQAGVGSDVGDLKDAWPGLVLRGGIDKRVLALDRDAIRDEVRRKFRIAWTRGGYLPCLDHNIPPDVSWDNFRYFIEAYRRYGESDRFL